MPRRPKPFVHQGYYYTTVGGVWHRLCPESDGPAAAARALEQLLGRPVRGSGPTVREVVEVFLAHADRYYTLPGGRASGEPREYRRSVRELLQLHGDRPAAELSREQVREAREAMIAAGLCRVVINRRISRIKRLTRWLAEHGHLPDAVASSIALLSPLPPYRSGVPEHDPVGPVAAATVAATLPHLREPWRSLVLLQWWSGLRPGEVCGLRLDQVQCPRPGEVVVDLGRDHKTGWRGRQKTVPLGEQAVCVIRPWLWRASVMRRRYLFWTAGTRSDSSKPISTMSYANTVARICRAAGVPHWHPNQLRHAFATRVRARLGLDAAQAALGHASADITQVYADLDQAAAWRVVCRLG